MECNELQNSFWLDLRLKTVVGHEKKSTHYRKEVFMYDYTPRYVDYRKTPDFNKQKRFADFRSTSFKTDACTTMTPMSLSHDNFYGAISKHIHDFLVKVDRNLNETVTANKELLCLRREIDYNNSNKYPNYDNQIIQSFYFLRYYAAYFAEYFYIYDKILKNKFIEGNSLNVLSLGCGNAVDYKALEFANSIAQRSRPINYIGVDAIDWSYRECVEDERNSANIYRENIAADAQESSAAKNAAACNMIIFPMSILEISQNPDFLRRWLLTCRFFANHIIILITWPLYYDQLVGASDKIVKIMNSLGYFSPRDGRFIGSRTVNKEKSWEDHTKLGAIIPGFEYPKTIKESWQVRCPSSCGRCKPSPMEFTKYFKYEIIRLEKQN